jgi:hypothetical protein
VYQYQERCLKGILGILFISRHAATNRHNERSVTGHNPRKGQVVPAGQEPPQQFGIRQIRRASPFRTACARRGGLVNDNSPHTHQAATFTLA